MSRVMQRGLRWVRRKYGGLDWWLRWSNRPYINYYHDLVERGARVDPRSTVGGLWNVLGPMQLEFLRAEGLQPHHELLDTGCGCLRGGLHFIRYLKAGYYWGTEISSEMLQAGQQFLQEAGLETRHPHLLTVDPDLTFKQLSGKQFDFVLAFGIFSDMPPEYVKECFASLHRVLRPGGRFYATFTHGPEVSGRRQAVKFQYTMEFFDSLANAHGYDVTRLSDFRHPRGHSMLRVSYKLAAVTT